jgi:hypothetical protein
MAIDPDPYRTLGVARGASREEIRRAYRALAKIHHPDAAGPGALPRFLAIQAAYEQLILRSGGRAGRTSSGRAPAPRRPWEADPDRTDATRRAYGGRGRTTGTNGSAPPRGEAAGSPGGTGPAGAGADGAAGTDDGPGKTGTKGARGAGNASSGWRARSGQRPGARPTGHAARDPGERPGSGGAGTTSSGGRGEGRRRNKATLGSTSYDDAGPFEPDWAGASWYGTTSGTYWTVNPKEYADPRKHGPEYQARARRASRASSPRGSSPESPAPSASPDGDGTPPAAGPSTHEPASADATHTTSTWWESTAASGPATEPEQPVDPTATAARAAGSREQPRPRLDPPPPDLGKALGDLGRAIADEHVGGTRGRVARAVIGWLPIAFGIGWAIGELTGCGRFAASCDGATGPFVLLLQGLLLGLLIVVPALASIAAVAAMTLLGVALIASLVLSATGGAAGVAERQLTLGTILVVGWFAGFAIALIRRVRELPTPGRPVS